jgi:hypothetical protein
MFKNIILIVSVLIVIVSSLSLVESNPIDTLDEYADHLSNNNDDSYIKNFDGDDGDNSGEIMAENVLINKLDSLDHAIKTYLRILTLYKSDRLGN